MITKEQLNGSFAKECEIVKHLCGKLTPAQMEFRITPNGRSTIELLRYLAACGAGPLKGAVSGDWKEMGQYFATTANLTADQIPAALDRQRSEISAVLETISESELLNNDVSFPWGYSDKLGIAIINTSLKFMTAYRLQLFLHAKASGCSALNTANCWGGIDMPM